MSLWQAVRTHRRRPFICSITLVLCFGFCRLGRNVHGSSATISLPLRERKLMSTVLVIDPKLFTVHITVSENEAGKCVYIHHVYQI